jgi:hypothetical protein
LDKNISTEKTHHFSVQFKVKNVIETLNLSFRVTLSFSRFLQFEQIALCRRFKPRHDTHHNDTWHNATPHKGLISEPHRKGHITENTHNKHNNTVYRVSLYMTSAVFYLFIRLVSLG